MFELTDTDRAGLARQHALLEALADDAETLVARGSRADAAGYVELAARLGWLNHTGLRASARLEGLIDRIAEEALPVVAHEPLRASDGRPQALHVLTEAYHVGGHTRVAQRWIERDPTHVHSLILAGNGPPPPPASLTRAVAGQGGQFLQLGGAGDLVSRARALRELAARFDRVVLHIHPYDALSALAFRGPGPRPTVLMMNHADHVFWIGHGSYDVLVCYREGGVRIARERRGVDEGRCTILRVPLDVPSSPRPDREGARRKLGIPLDRRVVLTVGSTYKYHPIGGPTLADAVMPALEARDDTILVVVGPEPTDEPWAGVAARASGKLAVAGSAAGIADYCAAADVYLEAYPCAGTTTLVDAAGSGLPVVTFAPDRVEAELLGTGHPDVPDARLVARDEGELADALGTLLDNPELRDRRAAELRAEIEARHSGADWRRSLEAAYERADELAGQPHEPGAEIAARAVRDESGREDAILYRLQRSISIGADDPLAPYVRAQRALSLAAHHPALRARLEHALGRYAPPVPDPYPAALAAPAAERAAIDHAVDAFRELDAAGYAQRFVLAIAPVRVDLAVPLIEAALAAGPDVDIDLVPVADPREVLDHNWLVVTAGAEPSEWAAGHPHVYGAPAPALA